MADLMIVFKGESSDELYTAYFDGKSWQGSTRISDQPGNISPRSSHAPGVAVYNNWLYLLYKGASSSDLYLAWWNGTQWKGDLAIREQRGGIAPKTDHGPNIVVYKGLLHTVYKGDGNDKLYSAYFDGTTWAGDRKIQDQTTGFDPKSSQNPGMVVFGEKLYIVYKSASSNSLRLAWFDGERWEGDKKISDMPGGISPASDHRVAAILFSRRLFIVYKGGSSNHLYTASFDGTTWYGGTRIKDQPGGIDPQSSIGPSAELYGSKLYIVYKSAGSAALRSAWFDSTRKWYGDTQIEKQPGGIDPKSNHTPGVSLMPPSPSNRSEWMRGLPDSLSIGQINLPGTHDSAAINTSIHTPYATQNESISHQLEYGIRLLDVRIQVSQKGTKFIFMTCHGSIGSNVGLNVYQSLSSLLEECRQFLAKNRSEVVLMSIKVDDWTTVDQALALADLKRVLNSYPVEKRASLPTLGEVRGRILLFNRIDDDLELGVPICWTKNTEGSYADSSSNRSYQVYVQDRFEELPVLGSQAEKLRLVTAAFLQKESSDVVWNFASATWYRLYGVYIQGDLLSYFGKDEAADRLEHFGWILFDYPFNFYNTTAYGSMNVVDLIISSNSRYAGYARTFKVISDGHGDL